MGDGRLFSEDEIQIRMPKELNPNHPVVREMDDQWHKLCAILMFKEGVTEIRITKEDIEEFSQSGRTNITVHPKGYVITLSLVDDVEAARLGQTGRGIADMKRAASTLMPNGRDIAIDPQVGDVAVRREFPSRKVVLTFTDAAGYPCLHYTETRCVSVKQWKRWIKRTGAHAEPQSR